MTARHGRINLIADKCTSCMLCVRECPVWCISLAAHAETEPATAPGGRARTVNVLDDFSIDYGLCMFCGICIDVCSFEALEWNAIDDLVEVAREMTVHDRERLAR